MWGGHIVRYSRLFLVVLNDGTTPSKSRLLGESEDKVMTDDQTNRTRRTYKDLHTSFAVHLVTIQLVCTHSFQAPLYSFGHSAKHTVVLD
jgi:hypothetical protein